MTRDDEVVQVRAENARLQAENGALRSARAAAQETIRQQQQALAGLEARVAELEQKPPPWAKAQTPPRPPKERKKRAPEHNKGRRREEPTQFVEHAYERRVLRLASVRVRSAISCRCSWPSSSAMTSWMRKCMSPSLPDGAQRRVDRAAVKGDWCIVSALSGNPVVATELSVYHGSITSVVPVALGIS